MSAETCMSSDFVLSLQVIILAVIAAFLLQDTFADPEDASLITTGSYPIKSTNIFIVLVS